MMYEMLNDLLTPLLQRIFSSLSESVTGTDDPAAPNGGYIRSSRASSW
jgi:hypothetical protein